MGGFLFMANYRKGPSVKPSIIIGVIAFFVLIIALIVLLTPSAERKLFNSYTTSTAVSEDVRNDLRNDDLFKNHVFKVVSLSDVKKKVENKDDFILHIGSASCSICVQGIGHYNKYFIENLSKFEAHVGKNIFYLEANTQGLYEFVVAQNMQAAAADGEQQGVGTPHLTYFKKGKVTYNRDDKIGDFTSELSFTREFYKVVANNYQA